MSAEFQRRWERATHELIAQVKQVLLDLLVAVAANALDGGVTACMIKGSFRDEDLLDYAKYLVEREQYWGSLEPDVQARTAVHLRSLGDLTAVRRRLDDK